MSEGVERGAVFSRGGVGQVQHRGAFGLARGAGARQQRDAGGPLPTGMHDRQVSVARRRRLQRVEDGVERQGHGAGRGRPRRVGCQGNVAQYPLDTHPPVRLGGAIGAGLPTVQVGCTGTERLAQHGVDVAQRRRFHRPVAALALHPGAVGFVGQPGLLDAVHKPEQGLHRRDIPAGARVAGVAQAGFEPEAVVAVERVGEHQGNRPIGRPQRHAQALAAGVEGNQAGVDLLDRGPAQLGRRHAAGHPQPVPECAVLGGGREGAVGVGAVAPHQALHDTLGLFLGQCPDLLLLAHAAIRLQARDPPCPVPAGRRARGQAPANRGCGRPAGSTTAWTAKYRVKPNGNAKYFTDFESLAGGTLYGSIRSPGQ